MPAPAVLQFGLAACILLVCSPFPGDFFVIDEVAEFAVGTWYTGHVVGGTTAVLFVSPSVQGAYGWAVVMHKPLWPLFWVWPFL